MPEAWGAWSDGPTAALVVRTDHDLPGIVIRVRAHGHLGSADLVRVHATCGEQTWSWDLQREVTELSSPPLVPTGGLLRLQLTFHEPSTPHSDDPRQLAMGLHELRLERAR